MAELYSNSEMSQQPQKITMFFFMFALPITTARQHINMKRKQMDESMSHL